MAKSDTRILVEYCAAVNCKFNELERSLIKWKLKLSTLVLQSGEESKTWIYLSLKDIREESNDIVRLMNTIRASLSDKDFHSDYYKYAMDELKYFTYEWEFTFHPEIERIFNQNDQLFGGKKSKTRMRELNIQTDNIDALRQLGETWRENEKLMQYIHYHIYETRETVINIKEMADHNLHFIQKGQTQISRAKKAQRSVCTLRSFGILCGVGLTLGTIIILLT